MNKSGMVLKLWELLAPYLASWVDSLIRKWIGTRGGKG